MAKLYSSYRRWADSRAKGDGVIVGSDLAQEWLLPWWWDHYAESNTHPVTFVDFGMSAEMQQWCRERGSYLKLPVADIFVSEKEEIDPALISDWEKGFGSKFWNCRSAWFKKPSACLLSPYHRSVWIDLDCEVRGSIKELFPLCDHETGISMSTEWEESRKIGYNSGVIVFKHGLPLIEAWADLSFEKNSDFRGDQEALSHIIEQQQLRILELPPIYNWRRVYKENPQAVIQHWHGDYGKSYIHHQIMLKVSR
jgi:hypothetical protein